MGRTYRTYGARNRCAPCTQGLRPGLTCFTPTALDQDSASGQRQAAV